MAKHMFHDLGYELSTLCLILTLKIQLKLG